MTLIATALNYSLKPGSEPSSTGKRLAETEPYDATRNATKVLARNAAHLARVLKDAPYPGAEQA